MKYCLFAAIAAVLLVSCNKNTDDKPVCTLGSNYPYATGNMQLPNAFTPNGDGKNDRFKPVWVYPSANFTLTISDKSGNTLFQTSDPNTSGWDGRNNAGEQMPGGRYAVRLISTDYYQQQSDFCVALLKYGPSNCIPQSDDGSYYFSDTYDSTSQNFTRSTHEVICPR